MLKTNILQYLTIVLFVILYSIAIKPYITIFNDFISINFSSFIIAFIITIIGSCIGYFFTKKTFRKIKMDYNLKNNIITAITSIIPIVLLVIYFVFGSEALQKTVLYLTKSVIIIFLTIIPVFCIYSIVKKKKNIFVTNSITVFIFLFYLFFLENIFENIDTGFYFDNQNTFLLVYFVLFICYLEIGLKSIVFSSMMKKISPDKDNENSFLLEKFNNVFNKSFLYLITFFVTSIILSLLVLNNNFDAIALKGLGSVDIIIILTILVIILSLLFWFFAAYDKSNKISSFKKK